MKNKPLADRLNLLCQLRCKVKTYVEDRGPLNVTLTSTRIYREPIKQLTVDPYTLTALVVFQKKAFMIRMYLDGRP